MVRVKKANGRSVLIGVGFGLLAAVTAWPELIPAQYSISADSRGQVGQEISQAPSPDLLAYLAFLNEQERIRADAHEKWTVEDRRKAIEHYRKEVDRRASNAGVAMYEAERQGRLSRFVIAELELRNEAEARIKQAELVLAEVRRAAEEDEQLRAREELAARVQQAIVGWDQAKEEMVEARAQQRIQDIANVEESREMVRAHYPSDALREARWARATAWESASRNATGRLQDAHFAVVRKASEQSSRNLVAEQAQAKLRVRIKELRQRDSAIIAALRDESDLAAKQRQSIFDAQEALHQSEAMAAIQQASQQRAEEWAAYEERQEKVRDTPRAGYLTVASRSL